MKEIGAKKWFHKNFTGKTCAEISGVSKALPANGKEIENEKKENGML